MGVLEYKFMFTYHVVANSIVWGDTNKRVDEYAKLKNYILHRMLIGILTQGADKDADILDCVKRFKFCPKSTVSVCIYSTVR